MNHTHSVVDTDKHFIIDAITREITTQSEELKLMQGDHNSEIYTFEIPKVVEGHDMSLCNRVEIHYNNVSGNKVNTSSDVYTVTDLRVDETDPEKLVFSWLVSGNATKYAGALGFRVRFCCIDENGVYTYKWHTGIFKEISVSEGLDNTAAVEEDFSDAFSEWEARLEAMEKAIEQGGGSEFTEPITTENIADDAITIEKVEPEFFRKGLSFLGTGDVKFSVTRMPPSKRVSVVGELRNKATEITQDASDDAIPTEKAVYDYVNNVIGGIENGSY